MKTPSEMDSHRDKVYRMELASQTVTEVVGRHRYGMRFQPDTDWLIYPETDVTFVVNQHDGTVVQLDQLNIDDGIGLTRLALWTPDNQYISYVGKNYWLYLFNPSQNQHCRMFEIDSNIQSYTKYDWRIIPSD